MYSRQHGEWSPQAEHPKYVLGDGRQALLPSPPPLYGARVDDVTSILAGKPPGFDGIAIRSFDSTFGHRGLI